MVRVGPSGGTGVIDHPHYEVDPWCLRETSLDLAVLAQSESVFALSNGHIGWRANLDEGDPYGLAGSYLNGVHELRPLPYAEAGYGYPEQDQVVVNVTDGKLIRLYVDDQPFDVRYGELHRHERVLDFRRGVLERSVDWSSASNRRVRIRTTRLVSLVQRSICAINYEVEAVDQPVRLVIQSELLANEPPPPSSGDPRVAAALDSPWRSKRHSCEGTWAELVHRTRRSKLTVSSAMDHVVTGPPSTTTTCESFSDLARLTTTVTLQPGERINLVKYVAYGWSAERSVEALRDQVDAALVIARQSGWDGLVAAQREFLDNYWENADVEIVGDDDIQQAVRFALFHLIQAGARSEGRAIPAKGLTGNGYDGHAFWDGETFVLPVLTYAWPSASAHALTWRHGTLPLAKDRADQLRLKGAAFAWRTITGAECSSYWPAGTAAFHVNADIADAALRYVYATGDLDFERDIGLELLVETSRLWLSVGHFDRGGAFRIGGVTGPDEYSAVADNNVYTNLMAQRNLRGALDAAGRHRERAAQLGVTSEEMTSWSEAGNRMYICFDESLGVHSQSGGFTDHEVWDFASTTPDQYPLLLNFPYFNIYRKQVVKQADLVLALYLRGDAFSAQEKKADFDYYEQLTVRDSSLSACTQAVVAAEIGYLSLAYDYVGEAALMDLDDLEHNTRDGLHLASLAGTWIALVAGLGGMREHADSLRFAPKLPEGLERLSFRLIFRGQRISIVATPSTTTYELREGEGLTLFHFERSFALTTDKPVTFMRSADDYIDPGVAPTQPIGRVPIHRVIVSDTTSEVAT